MTGHKIAVGTMRIKDGKLIRVHRLPAGQRKNVHAKASRQEKKWKDKSPSKT